MRRGAQANGLATPTTSGKQWGCAIILCPWLAGGASGQDDNSPLTRRGLQRRCSSAPVSMTSSDTRRLQQAELTALGCSGTPMPYACSRRSDTMCSSHNTFSRRARVCNAPPVTLATAAARGRIEGRGGDLGIDDDVSHGCDGGRDAGQEHDHGADVMHVLPDRVHWLHLRKHGQDGSSDDRRMCLRPRLRPYTSGSQRWKGRRGSGRKGWHRS